MKFEDPIFQAWKSHKINKCDFVMYRSNEINQVIVLVIFIQYVCPICGEKYAIFGMEISLNLWQTNTGYIW